MNQLGTNDLVRWMQENDIPVTRDNYIELAYLGDPPPIDEIDFPEELQEE